MGTRADYYVGRGEKAIWLGSTAWDGYPDGLNDDILKAESSKDFVAAVAKWLDSRDDGTVPDNGWPWPWVDSNTTDYSYAFDDGLVYISCFGWGWISHGEWRALQDECDAYNKKYHELSEAGMDEDAIEKEIGNGPDDDFWREENGKNAYPDMTDIQNVNLGARSGAIFLKVP